MSLPSIDQPRHTATRRQFLRRLVAPAGLVLVAALAGCSFTPVYKDANVGSEAQLLLSYNAPASRLDQIVYLELASRLGRSASPDAAKVSVSTSARTRRVGRSASNSALTTYEATISGSLTVTSSGAQPETLVSASRQATAQYEITDQTLADTAARQDAEERAARALADSFRLLILSQLSAGN